MEEEEEEDGEKGEGGEGGGGCGHRSGSMHRRFGCFCLKPLLLIQGFLCFTAEGF